MIAEKCISHVIRNMPPGTSWSRRGAFELKGAYLQKRVKQCEGQSSIASEKQLVRESAEDM